MSNRPPAQKRIAPQIDAGPGKRADEYELNFNFDAGTEVQLRESVEATELPPDLQNLVDTYQEVLHDRNEYQWKWLFRIFDFMTLSCVPERYLKTVREVKTMMAMYNAMLDDLAEEHDDPDTFWELAKVAYPGPDPDWDRTDINQDYTRVVHEVWQAIDRTLQKAPRHDEFIEQFRFGLRQALTSMDHSRLSMNKPEMSNLTETWLYGPHNLMVYSFVDTDLMFSPSFSTDDYDEIREVAHKIQQMWRIGNWVATWKREIYERDYSAGIVVAALQKNVIPQETLDRLEAGEVAPESVIECISNAEIEEAFLADWQRQFDELQSRKHEVETVDLDELSKGTETLFKYHLASRGKMKES